MLLIGVSPCFMYPDPGRIVFGRKSLNYLEKDMGRYLSRPDVMPILIPDLPADERSSFVAKLDGLVLQGGTDLAPQTYGEQPIIPGKWLGDPERDAYEMELIRDFLSAEKPIFGICRGLQLLNAYFGGTLYQDLETQRPDLTHAHRDAMQYDQVHHPVELLPGLHLARLYADDLIRLVNSVHHQAIKDLGGALEATAMADGLVEAIQWKEVPPGKVQAVQWHPEFFWNSVTPLMGASAVYESFLQHCREK
ncbi:MAG: gamma-glutamyl-gamma-aminobutyrate hydrolase family protein [Bacteroidota bacterium]